MGSPARDIWKEQADELVKVWRAFSYFINEYCWIEDKTPEGLKPIPFKLWKCQQRILPLFLTAMRLIMLKARQLGLTWLCAAYALWLCITRPMQEVVVISAKEQWAIEFLERVKFICRRLPPWMVPPITKGALDKGGQELQFEHLDEKGIPVHSTIKSLTTTVEGAQSKTPTLLILDETARNRYIREIWAASKPGIDAAGGRIIVISNSIKDGVGWAWTRDTFVKAFKGLINFDFLFMAWFDHPRRPKNFIDLKIREGDDPEDVSWHYPATIQEAISAAAGSYFGKTLTRHNDTMPGITGSLARDNRKEIVFTGEKKGILEIWRYPYNLLDGYDGVPWKDRYCMGSDVSEGLGQTYSVAYVKDRLLNELVCRMRSNRVDAEEWAKMLYLLSLYYPEYSDKKPGGNRICVERNGAGQTTIKKLSRLGANQYLRLIPDKVGGTVTRQMGWPQNPQAIHEFCGDLKTWFRTTTGTVYDAILLEEAGMTILHEGTLHHGGRIGPLDETKLWDCVVAAGMTIQASLSIGVKPKRIEPGPDGWLKKWQGREL